MDGMDYIYQHHINWWSRDFWSINIFRYHGITLFHHIFTIIFTPIKKGVFSPCFLNHQPTGITNLVPSENSHVNDVSKGDPVKASTPWGASRWKGWENDPLTKIRKRDPTVGGGNSKIFYFHPENWGRWTHFDEYFSKGLKPPTRDPTPFFVWDHGTHN